MPHTSFLEKIPNKLSYEVISGNLTKKTLGDIPVLVGNLDSFVQEFNEVGAPLKFVISKQQQFANTADEISEDILEALAAQEESFIKLYPNPFVNDLIISYSLENPSKVEVKITDIYGEKISILSQGENQLAGKHSYFFDGSHLKKGTYVVSVTVNNERKTRIIVKK
ncbi:T9SS type A sorting domain-containing protein [Tenacibaculum maritimum]|nr:T9SS type A sorting domain-containing protein [Tenacibaculum maritimum]MCD9580772.1 T9SS type A sorting domain-containing protein [Tenacibaculum maritimum]MCD9635046.1 T9SS type A sorting domain-containing protein [Tenacibaculum maritimum]